MCYGNWTSWALAGVSYSIGSFLCLIQVKPLCSEVCQWSKCKVNFAAVNKELAWISCHRQRRERAELGRRVCRMSPSPQHAVGYMVCNSQRVRSCIKRNVICRASIGKLKPTCMLYDSPHLLEYKQEQNIQGQVETSHTGELHLWGLWPSSE